jgi:hypothetical protein
MDNQNYIHLPNLSSLTNNSNIHTRTSPISFLISTPLNSATSSLDHIRSHKIHSENIIITQPTVKYINIKYNFFSLFAIFSKLLSDTIKQEEFENNSIQETYSITNRSKTKINQLPPPTGKLFL